KNFYLDYDNGFLEDQLDRPQISIMALIKDIDHNDIVEIWEVIDLSTIYKHYIVLLTDGGHLCTYVDSEVLQQQSIIISTMFQQQATDIIIPDLHIIEQIHGTNICSATNQQVANKKVKYAKGFGKMKKALNLALDFGFDEKLINMITLFTDQKMSARNIDDKSSLDQLESIIINDPLVTKHRGRPATKRLKSSSENQSHEGPAYINHAMNPQDSNLQIPLSNIDLNNSYASGENKRKYVCNICDGLGHNACTCKQNNDSKE
ncbi:41668_t:CDS:2, partial [Gigaspora margarita]